MVTRDWTAARAKVEAEGVCRLCRRAGTLEAAHVLPRSLGGGMAEDAIVPLCPHCHRDYDAGAADLLPVLTKDEQAEAVRVVGLTRALAIISPEFNPRRAA